MRASGAAPRVAVAASDRAEREWLRDLLAADFPVEEVPSLGDVEDGRRFDAVAALVAFTSDEADVALLASVRSLGAGLVLITRDLSDSALAAALARIAPEHWLPAPVARAALVWAVRRAARDPDTRLGTAERRQHAALLGISVEIRRVIEEIRQIATAEMPVLVLGETGTGKELVARAIHDQSRRASGPFVAINCSALPETLLESELFGFARGAFTGATHTRRGLFEQASGGTLLLDEIGDTSMAMQAKLLRVLETKRIRPLGSERERSVDVRVVSATHRNLDACVKSGAFRQDLLYRLNAATIAVPPLRRRRADIPLLAQHFAEELGAANARRITLSDGALEALTRQDFPGNVRELRNAIERAIARARPDEILDSSHFGLDATGAVAAPLATGTLRERTEHLEAQAIRDAMLRFEGNRTRMAEALGLSRLGLRQKMRRLGLDAEEPR
jgi:DNA-binding NtrC family response regulator